MGYNYIIVDGTITAMMMLTIDCWMAPNRSESGDLVANPNRFPSGIKFLADKIHSIGLKFGIYESAGTKTCQGLPGSLGTVSPKSH